MRRPHGSRLRTGSLLAMVFGVIVLLALPSFAAARGSGHHNRASGHHGKRHHRHHRRHRRHNASADGDGAGDRSEEHTSELQSQR